MSTTPPSSPHLTSPPRRPRRHLRLRFAVVAVVTGTVLAACGGGGSSDDGTATDGATGTDASTQATPGVASAEVDELVIATPSLPTSFSFDAGGGSGLEYQEFLRANSATLVRNPYVRNDDGNLMQDVYDYEGYLAESYEVSPDGMVLTFKLRQGVLSPAGNELDADDVVYSFQRRYATPTSSAKAVNFPYITDANQVQKVDQYTVTITLLRANDAFTVLSLISNIANYIYDSDLLEQHETAEDPYAVVWSKTNANYGFGPYILESFVPDQEMVLVSNPNHALGEPKIKKLTFKLVNDPGSRANALRSGDADVASALRPADQVDLAKDPKFTIYDFDTNSFLLYSFVTTHAPFDDKEVRRAMSLAIPYDQIIESVYASERAQRNIGLLPPDAPGYDGDGLTPYEYDPERAKEILAEAGHPDGVEFKLTVSNAVPDVQEAAVLIQSYAKDAGFDIEIEELPPAAYAAARLTQTWDAFMYRDYAITLSPPYELYLFFKPEPAPSATGWRPADYYEILDRGIAAGDPLGDEAGKIWNEAQQYLLEENPMIFVTNLQPLNGFRAGVTDFAWRSDNLIDYTTLSATES